MNMLRSAMVLCALLVTACGDATSVPPTSSASPSLSASASSAVAPTKLIAPSMREGQALIRSEDEDVLYLADEDASVLRRITLTADIASAPQLPTPMPDQAPDAKFVDATETKLTLPGRPAQVISLGATLLVTIRDPGLLLFVRAGTNPEEVARVPLPYDAWGVAVSQDLKSAYVTSAWSHKVSKVDLDKRALAWSVDVVREPRGMSVSNDGRHVYVSHLIGADITHIDVSGEPRVERIALPADPLATSAGETLSASLGYATMLSPDGARLYVARHALGALWAWQGTRSVDVLETRTNTPLTPQRKGKPIGTFTQDELEQMRWITDQYGARSESDSGKWQQPRAMILRKRTKHLLIASEGQSLVAELDATSIAPGMITNRYYRLGGLTTEDPTKIQIPPHCGAPTGIALSKDEDVLYAYCRTTDNIVAVRLTPDGERALQGEITYVANAAYHTRLSVWGPFAYAKLSVAPMDEEYALGRRLYFDATEPVVSEAMACSGCHPDGRDDGHVWREQRGESAMSKLDGRFLAGPTLSRNEEEKPQNYGAARQTPMLAGRVNAQGPYGWRAESATLVDRVKEGFILHRSGQLRTDGLTMKNRAAPLAAFIRKGLVAPPRPTELSSEEQKGRAIFTSPKTECASCHAPEKDFTDRTVIPLIGFRTRPLFTEDEKPGYRVPSLLYVGSTAPYYHDGSAETLEQLVSENKNRMGKTNHLSDEEKAALVAYLKTL
jgi:DNA-binding beta-propeller fold protein YncE/mono/diheme cytochrome c family protein